MAHRWGLSVRALAIVIAGAFPICGRRLSSSANIAAAISGRRRGARPVLDYRRHHALRRCQQTARGSASRLISRPGDVVGGCRRNTTSDPREQPAGCGLLLLQPYYDTPLLDHRRFAVESRRGSTNRRRVRTGTGFQWSDHDRSETTNGLLFQSGVR